MNRKEHMHRVRLHIGGAKQCTVVIEGAYALQLAIARKYDTECIPYTIFQVIPMHSHSHEHEHMCVEGRH